MLSLPADIATQYFQDDVMKFYQRDEKKLKDMLYFLENVDYAYNSKNNIIIKMSNHLNNERNFMYFLEIFSLEQDIFCIMKPEVIFVLSFHQVLNLHKYYSWTNIYNKNCSFFSCFKFGKVFSSRYEMMWNTTSNISFFGED